MSRTRSRFLIVFVLIGALLALPGDADAARRKKKKYATTTTATFTDTETPVDVQDEFSGDVNSPNAACVPNRLVRVFREAGTTDVQMGIAETDTTGLWSFFNENAIDGQHYAQVTAKGLSPTKICLGVTQTFNVSNTDGPFFDADTVYVDGDPDGPGIDDATCGGPPFGGSHPCLTIAFGLQRASALNRTNVAVAGGFYPEAVTLVNGKNLRGGYSSDFQTRNTENHQTLIAGSSTIPATNHVRAITASGITSPTVLDGFTIIGPDTNTVSGNTYAIHVTGSDTDLQITNNQVIAGVAGDGNPGGNGPDGSAGGNGVNGLSATGESDSPGNRSGGAGGTNAQASNGGAGGGASEPNVEFTKQGDGVSGSGTGSGTGGLGGTDGSLGDCPIFFLPTSPAVITGADGTSGADGADASGGGTAGSNGSITGGHWSSSAGGSGQNGTGGAGGGGGGASGGQFDRNYTTNCDSATTAVREDRTGATGGGGGAGGSGGTGGSGGGGGGGSFGIFIVGGSAPTITGNEIQRGIGGDGGAGGAAGFGGVGGTGGTGGGPGTSVFLDSAGNGGDGGSGGRGSGGGGGAGGRSAGILTSGIGSPSYGAQNNISGGSGGAGGAGGVGATSGAAGSAGALLTVSSI